MSNFETSNSCSINNSLMFRVETFESCSRDNSPMLRVETYESCSINNIPMFRVETSESWEDKISLDLQSEHKLNIYIDFPKSNHRLKVCRIKII